MGSLDQTLRANLTDVDRTIQALVEQAREAEIDPYRMRHMDGSLALAPLLLAKSNTLLALATLKAK